METLIHQRQFDIFKYEIRHRRNVYVTGCILAICRWDVSMDNEREQSGDEWEDSRIDRLNRREYMRVLGGLGVVGALGGLGSRTATAETADISKTVDERIQEHRTGSLEVIVENSDGSAVSNADVSITQQEHDFGFGTAVNADTLINNSSPGDNYREYIPELFNKAVIENRTKWA